MGLTLALQEFQSHFLLITYYLVITGLQCLHACMRAYLTRTVRSFSVFCMQFLLTTDDLLRYDKVNAPFDDLYCLQCRRRLQCFLPRTILLHEYVPVRSDLYINDLKAFPSRAGAHSI